MANEHTATAPNAGLQANAIGLREVLFQSVTAMAPAAAIAASIPAGAAFAGGSLPLAVIFAGIACLLVALCVGELAAHLPSAGSVATYSARGLHPSVGFLVAWGYLFVEALVPTLLFLQLGFTVAPTIHDEWHSYPADLWWPWAMLGALIVAAAGYRGVQTSARLGTLLGAFEVLVFVVLAALLIVRAGSANTLSVFTAAHSAPGHAGIGGVIAGSVYTILAFSGFEAAAPLAEEATNPRRTVRRAVVGATIGIGIIYVFTTYAAVVFTGPDKFASFATGTGWEGIARSAYGLFWILVFFAVVNSCLANANAGANVSTRTAFALGRIGVLPRALTSLHPRFRSPQVAVLIQFAIGVVVTLALGLHYGATTAFLLVATMIVIVIALVYIVVSAACMGFFLRERRDEFHVVRHLVIPILAIASLIPAFFNAAGLRVFSFVTALTAPVSYAGIIVGIWMIIGVAYLVYLSARDPRRVADVGLVHLDEPVEPVGTVAR